MNVYQGDVALLVNLENRYILIYFTIHNKKTRCKNISFIFDFPLS